eukprot:4530171-Alexandrium_andersonii.AAC.1
MGYQCFLQFPAHARGTAAPWTRRCSSGRSAAPQLPELAPPVCTGSTPWGRPGGAGGSPRRGVAGVPRVAPNTKALHPNLL